MNLSVLKSEKIDNFPPILIVDRIGIIGEALAQDLSNDFLVVLISKSAEIKSDKIIHIPFKRKIPQAPDNNYKKIFIIDDGDAVTKESTTSFIEKAKDTNTPLYFIGSIRNVDLGNVDVITSTYANAKVLMFGDLFDKNIFFDKEIAINKYIIQARRDLKIEVEGNGLGLSFPITFKDTIKLIVKASYLDIPQKVILLFYPHPITDISLANTFRKVNPDVKIDFTKAGRARNIYIPQDSQHAIEKYKLEDKIKELDLENRENRKLIVVPVHKIKERPIFASLILILTLTIFLVLLPIISTSSYLFLGQRELLKSVEAIEEGDIEGAKNKANNSKTLFEMSEKTLIPLTLEVRALGRETAYFSKKVATGKKLSSATQDLISAAEQIKSIQRNESTDPEKDFVTALNLARSSIVLITQVKTDGNLPVEIENKFESLKPFIEVISSSDQILPELFGFDGEVTYLVLFQDNTHLRPGGGLINSYAILKLKNGKVVGLETFPSSQIDENLSTRVEPPFFIRRYIPSQDLLLKDSSFNPDFVEGAKSQASIYNLSKDETVNGVIAVDFEFAKNILKAAGEVNIEEGQINSENLYDFAEKSDISKNIADSLVGKIRKGKSLSYLKIAEMIGKSISEKHLLFALRDLKNQTVFTSNRWSGALDDKRAEKKGVINDYFGISEANLGIGNLNNQISRSVSKKIIATDSGSLTTKITISFKNNSGRSGSLGTYKNYLRVLTPGGSSLEGVVIDGQEQEIMDAVTNFNVYEASGFVPPDGLEIYETLEKEKKNVGFLLSIEPQKTKTVVLTYTLAYKISPSPKENIYSLVIYKQPGVKPYPFDLSFDLGKKFKIVGERDIYDSDISKDEEIKFIISEK